jgi:hypothetical protein
MGSKLRHPLAQYIASQPRGSIYLSIYLSVCLSVCLSIHPSVRLSIHPSICLCVCVSVCLSVCLSIYISTCLSIYLSTYFCFSCSHLEHRASVKHIVSLQFLNLKQSVGPLGKGISPTQGRHLQRAVEIE